MKIKATHFAALAALTLAASPTVAQNTADPAATATYPATQDDGDDDSGKWGLLGLLGLAGLLNLKRRDRDDHIRTGTTDRR